MRSLTWRITGLMFLSIFLTVMVLVIMANYQMTAHFETYLTNPHNGSSNHQQDIQLASVMGLPERIFIESIHRSLFGVGGAILLIGLLASYALSRSITVPLHRLSKAVDEIGKGKYGQQVDVLGRDEVGKLANAFNEMSERLATSVKLRRRLLADIAHELRTPLTVIQGNLEGMLDGVVEKSDEQIGSLYEETLYLNRMIQELRDLSLAEAGQLHLEKLPVDLNAMIHHTANMLEPLAEEKGIIIVEELQAVPAVLADMGRINQVLYNLMTNALRYTPNGGTIVLSSEPVIHNHKEWTLIGVKDTGTGIAKDDLPFIFEHFYRSDKSRNKKSGGSGIGLSIVKQLIELHGGFVEVKSTLGEGSIFMVYLPVNKDK